MLILDQSGLVTAHNLVESEKHILESAENSEMCP